IPVDKYFDEHPEWFVDPGNGNKPATHNSKMPEDRNTQLCLENEELFNEFLNNTLDWIKSTKQKKPNINIFSVSINDNQRYCQCLECAEVIKAEGAPSGSLIRFVNKLSVEVKKRYPKVELQTLAYFSFLKPPKN